MTDAYFIHFVRFQTAMRPAVPAIEIDKISRELEKFASEFGEVIIPEDIPRYFNIDSNNLSV